MIYHIQSRLPYMQLAEQRVLLRADFNVSLHDGKIIDDFRLQAVRPTLDFLIKQGARVLLVTHLGRPQAREQEFSTRHFVSWFMRNGYAVQWAETIEQAAQLLEQPHAIVLLENIRFWRGEQHEDIEFAQKLRSCADIYVLDAFGALHRTDTSLVRVPQLFDYQFRTIGFLVEHELQVLNTMLEKPLRPFVAIIGGAKLETKAPLLEKLLTLVDTLALLPLLDKGMHMQELKTRAREFGKQILVPTDYLVGTNGWGGEYKNVVAEQIDHSKILTIGTSSVPMYKACIAHAGTVLINGLSGDIRYPVTVQPARILVQALCVHKKILSVVAGGDSVGLVHSFGLTACVQLLSTGGGASVAYICGQQLPALQAFI